MKNATKHLFLLALVAVVLLWSAINPHDYFTWFLEVVPALLAFILLCWTYKRFPLSNFTYGLIALHSIVLIIGGHYTYAEVPVFNYLRDIGLFTRNNYDKVGHFAQGFFPAIVIREVLLRKSPVPRGPWLSLFIVSLCLSVSALYEIIEWWVSVASGSAGDSFLGTQGYIWDTQSDMLLAFLGAIAAVLCLSKLHDRSMKRSDLLP